jgi:hypothetical protein
VIILRDGDPGEQERALGGFGSTYYQHTVEIKVYIEEGDAAVRDAAFDALLQQIGAALDATRRSAICLWPHLRPARAGTRGGGGAPAIKAATLIVTVEYESNAPLS